jgi:hypothetical protein
MRSGAGESTVRFKRRASTEAAVTFRHVSRAIE